MKLIPIAAAAALALAAATPAVAVDTTIDFETATSFASVAQYYNGGADSAGNIGPALGVSFGGDVLGLMNDALGPYFSNAPSPLGTMTVVGSDATMNVAAGFTGAISFWYSADTFTLGAVSVWSGLNGTGSIVASFNLVNNATDGCSSSAFCRFDRVASTFQGIARSVTFANAANVAVFDNINVNVVPEPTTLALMLGGILAVGSLARRRLG